MYDIIGDIHGYAEPLHLLLKKMGYEKRQGAFRHAERKLIFVGDFIDRGPDSRTVLHTVRAMCEAGSAYAVMGNHEYNAICMHTLSSSGEFLREHSAKNLLQFSATARSFYGFDADWLSHLEWIKLLPLFLEMPEGLRVVHASWRAETIAEIKKISAQSILSPQLLAESRIESRIARKIVGDCLVGQELILPEEFHFSDADGHRRSDMRIKWWESPEGKTLREIGLSGNFPDLPIPESWYERWPMYSEEEWPVFFGHYWMKGQPTPQRPNVCCVDYSIADGGVLAAYRWNGEKALRKENLVWI